MEQKDNNKPFEELANAIIVRAVKDYRKAESEEEREGIRKFFCSAWFMILTRMNPQMLIRELDKEIINGEAV